MKSREDETYVALDSRVYGDLRGTVEECCLYEIAMSLGRIADMLANQNGYYRINVVRCKDCKFNVANMEKDLLDTTDYTDIVCSYFMTDGMEPYDFCSVGERNDT